jgi:hypothetical protein
MRIELKEKKEIFQRNASVSNIIFLFSSWVFDYDELICISKFKHGFTNEHAQQHIIDK